LRGLVPRYVKNHNPGFAIRYTIGGEQKHSVPDYIVHLDDPLQLIVEVTGQTCRDKEAKTDTAEKLWVPAVNNAAEWGRWAFLEITDPWNAMDEIRDVASSADDTDPRR
jgi:type III restriction enzyme